MFTALYIVGAVLVGILALTIIFKVANKLDKRSQARLAYIIGRKDAAYWNRYNNRYKKLHQIDSYDRGFADGPAYKKHLEAITSQNLKNFEKVN